MIKETTREEFEKVLFQLDQEYEGKTGIKVLMAYKCIRCGQIFDTFFDAADHVTEVHER